MTSTLHLAHTADIAWAQNRVTQEHYLHKPVDMRCSPLAYLVVLGKERVGCLLFGRPEATRCYQGGLTYGSLGDVRTGRAQYDRWQIQNLPRVWLSKDVQIGGQWYGSEWLPGYTDRRGVWRSTLASTIIQQALDRVVTEYLVAYPPCFLDEPYAITQVLSYCDRRVHRGIIYPASGFTLVRTSGHLETYARSVRLLTHDEHARIMQLSLQSPRSQYYRSMRVTQRICQQEIEWS